MKPDCHSVHPNQIFKKGGLERTSTFRGGDFFHEGGYNFHIKNKLKSEIFNDKKKKKKKIFFSVVTKNSNGEILTKNLVTFKTLIFWGFTEKWNF